VRPDGGQQACAELWPANFDPDSGIETEPRTYRLGRGWIGIVLRIAHGGRVCELVRGLSCWTYGDGRILM
jgi:hypothetical protein